LDNRRSRLAQDLKRQLQCSFAWNWSIDLQTLRSCFGAAPKLCGDEIDDILVDLWTCRIGIEFRGFKSEYWLENHLS
jgi:hypothetical protein